MADNDQFDDEYHFADLDMDSPVSEETETSTETPMPTLDSNESNVRRNSLIVIAAVIVFLIFYKFIGSFFSTTKQATDDIAATPIIQPAPAPVIQQPKVEPVTVAPPVPAVVPNQDIVQMNQKISSLELSQESLRNQVNSVSSQLGGINTNVNDLSEKIASLTQSLNTLMEKVDRQSSEINMLMDRTRPKPAPKVVKERPAKPIYYIQAVIPGRAWLISPNGSTLTVRVGTLIQGYGVVSSIDAIQGRVMTSSGQVIRFSQRDS